MDSSRGVCCFAYPLIVENIFFAGTQKATVLTNVFEFQEHVGTSWLMETCLWLGNNHHQNYPP